MKKNFATKIPYLNSFKWRWESQNPKIVKWQIKPVVNFKPVYSKQASFMEF